MKKNLKSSLLLNWKNYDKIKLLSILVIFLFFFQNRIEQT
jgi:hypothetical protein